MTGDDATSTYDTQRPFVFGKDRPGFANLRPCLYPNRPLQIPIPKLKTTITDPISARLIGQIHYFLFVKLVGWLMVWCQSQFSGTEQSDGGGDPR